MAMEALEQVQDWIATLAGRAKYGFRGEKPLAAYAILQVMRAEGLKGLSALEVLEQHPAAVEEQFSTAARKWRQLRDPSVTWSVITGPSQDLQRTLLKGGGGAAVARLESGEVEQLVKWFEGELERKPEPGQ